MRKETLEPTALDRWSSASLQYSEPASSAFPLKYSNNALRDDGFLCSVHHNPSDF